jgi:hypothetical protein
MAPYLYCYGASPKSTEAMIAPGSIKCFANPTTPSRAPRPMPRTHTTPTHTTTPASICSCTPSPRFTATQYTLPTPDTPFDSPRPIFCAATFPLLVRFLGMTIHGMHSAEKLISGAQFIFSGRRLGCTWDTLTRTKSSSPFYLPPRLQIVSPGFLTPPRIS